MCPSHDHCNMHGYCLTELLIGMAVAVVVLAGCLEVLRLSERAVEKSQRKIAQQQELRLGLEVIGQEIRLAAADSFISADEHEFEFEANLHGLKTNTTHAVIPGQSVLPVLDGSGWGEGKTVLLCHGYLCERHRLLRSGQQHQLLLEEAVRDTFPAGTSVEVRNRMVYYLKKKAGIVSLMRMVDGGAGVLIGGLKSVSFSYRNKAGHTTRAPNEVALVRVEIEPQYWWKKEECEFALRS